MSRLGFAEDSEPFIDISDRPFDDNRPIGPLVGCGDDHDDKLGGSGGTFAFTVDEDTIDHNDDVVPTPQHVVQDMVVPRLPSELGVKDVEVEKKRTGDIRVGIDISDVGMGVIDDLRGMVNDIEAQGVEVYDVRIQ